MSVKMLVNVVKTAGLVSLLCMTSLTQASEPSAAAKEQAARDANLKQKFPVQYESWLETSEQTEREDMLASYPAAIILWAGSSFAKEYNSPRGHHFAVADVTHTLRTGVPPKAGDKGLSASCWTCKTPDAPRLMNELGIEGFSAKNFTDVGKEVNSVVYCTDCHVDGKAELALPRPHAQDAMAKVHLPFDKQNNNMKGAQVCGQCHVTYYFQPERSNKVNIPWIFGNNVDDIEKYYDTRRFYEWIHPISQTPILKARHPEFEHWSRSKHAEAGVTCITCHMPETTDEQGNSFTSHKVSKALDHFDEVCQSCHKSEKKIISALDKNKATIDAKAREVEGLLVKAHYEAGAAWDAGATWTVMNDAIMAIRHSQWRWDFAMASHGLYAHNPEEGNALLDMALRQVKYARTSLDEILKKFDVKSVNYPDISSKASAHAAVGIELEKLTEAKKKFIKEDVDKNWSEVTKYGYE
ncbi:cytochrome c-552 [Shewanella sp. c952]|uniref:ammonia-forming cytochrome c nitrite reductase subunit c552 n=1 Tax=Shewanella sp. c952 TaxID=2815913 RepID=UPI001BC28DF0|nr:cytochrome c-552 [Shewanella sp. c952]